MPLPSAAAPSVKPAGAFPWLRSTLDRLNTIDFLSDPLCVSTTLKRTTAFPRLSNWTVCGGGNSDRLGRNIASDAQYWRTRKPAHCQCTEQAIRPIVERSRRPQRVGARGGPRNLANNKSAFALKRCACTGLAGRHEA